MPDKVWSDYTVDELLSMTSEELVAVPYEMQGPWKDDVDDYTPISPDRLNRMEAGIKRANDAWDSKSQGIEQWAETSLDETKFTPPLAANGAHIKVHVNKAAGLMMVTGVIAMRPSYGSYVAVPGLPGKYGVRTAKVFEATTATMYESTAYGMVWLESTGVYSNDFATGFAIGADGYLYVMVFDKQREAGYVFRAQYFRIAVPMPSGAL